MGKKPRPRNAVKSKKSTIAEDYSFNKNVLIGVSLIVALLGCALWILFPIGARPDGLSLKEVERFVMNDSVSYR